MEKLLNLLIIAEPHDVVMLSHGIKEVVERENK